MCTRHPTLRAAANMSALADQIAELLRAHQLEYATDRCICGFHYPDYDDTGAFHAAHVAEKIAELFTEDTLIGWADGDVLEQRRWVSAWITNV